MKRRTFLQSSSAVAVAAAAGPIARTVDSRSRPDSPWIPSDQFLVDLPRLMDLASLPGLSAAVVEAGIVVWKRAFGVANATTRAPLREEATFEAASMSKPVFAYVVMRLADEHLLDLDRPLVEYRRPDYLASHPWVELITARDVLRHSTGLPNWRLTPEDRLTPAFKPGTAWRYSGEGYFWLQLVVEQLTSGSLDGVMRSRLFDPAEMTVSTYAWDARQEKLAVFASKGPGDDAGTIPFQYNREIGELLLLVAQRWQRPLSTWRYEDVVRALPEARALPQAARWPENIAKAPIEYLALPVNAFSNAAGSLRTTAAEYATFMSLLMTAGPRRPWTVSESSRRAMLTPSMPVKPGNGLYSWGLGWSIEQRSGSGPTFHHGGNNAQVFKTFGVGDAEARRAIVVFTNGGGGNEIAAMLVRHATGLDPIQFL